MILIPDIKNKFLKKKKFKKYYLFICYNFKFNFS